MIWLLAGGILAVLVIWQVIASFLFLAVQGFWGAYPWPDKAWMWVRYAVEAPPNAIIQRWLIITAVLSVLPLLIVAAPVIKWRLKAKVRPVYGETTWADRKEMRGRDIAPTRHLP
jgi:hypothetical protein